MTISVEVTWQDGHKDNYTCEDTRIISGVLTLVQQRYSEVPTRYIPLGSMQQWTEK